MVQGAWWSGNCTPSFSYNTIYIFETKWPCALGLSFYISYNQKGDKCPQGPILPRHRCCMILPLLTCKGQ